ncbi:unnamed protein product [Cylindrotheca closterium]|uniref:HSF-type DNA-binding domain-containing protein n=1 Tax=Cylindrotheca closterium TaxID=2856 RepID=A0AAD2FEM2_9STRA|nr:unnamed protein product [Cylindrotheca closterium]
MNRLAQDADKPTVSDDSSSTQGTAGSKDKVTKPPEPSSNTAKLNFPGKLHIILSTPEFNDIICWLPHGRAWRVQQQERLESEILPKFFQHQKAASFYRQVTGWGFNRITKGNDFNAYYHELFLRDATELCKKMKRPTRTELSERKQAIPKAPPDFYVMPPATVATSDPDHSSEQNMTSDEYQDMLVRRLSTYSLSEKGMFLQLELNKMEQKKSEIVNKLKEYGFGSRSSTTSERSSPPVSSDNSYQQQQATTLSSTTAAMQSSNLQQALVNSQLQQQSSSFNPFTSLAMATAAASNNYNHNSAAASMSTATSSLEHQLRLALLQQMQQQQSQQQQSQQQQQQASSFFQQSPLSQFALQNYLRGGGGNGHGGLQQQEQQEALNHLLNWQ